MLTTNPHAAMTTTPSSDPSAHVATPPASYIEQACQYCARRARLPGVAQPYRAATLDWREVRYYYVFGHDRKDTPRLIEVFHVGASGALEPVAAFQYPPALTALFPLDMAMLYHASPWGSTPPSINVSQLADALREMLRDGRSRGVRHA